MPILQSTYRGIKIFSEGKLWYFFYKGDKFIKVGMGSRWSTDLAKKTIDWFKDGDPLLFKKSFTDKKKENIAFQEAVKSLKTSPDDMDKFTVPTHPQYEVYKDRKEEYWHDTGWNNAIDYVMNLTNRLGDETTGELL